MIRLSLFCLLLACGCQILGPDAGYRGAQGDELRIVPFPAQIVAPADEVDVTGLALHGDSLRIAVRYGGGCEEHAFGLYWDGNVAESFPPQVTFFLSHDHRDDPCDAIEARTVSFDIDKLFQRLGDRYVVIHVHPLGEGESATLQP